MDIMGQQMKTVTILLTRYSGLAGRFISGISRYGYSHASISIDAREEIFYSFNYKGFVIEKPKKRRPQKRRDGSMIIRIQVPEETYVLLKREIIRFINNREKYKYTRFGVLLCLMHIPFKFTDKYFCSQFVAEILEQAGAVKLKKKDMLYLPGNLVDGMECLFSQKQIVYNVI